MDEPIQMYIITAPCWKCDKEMNVAVIKGDKKRHDFCGPEKFSEEEKKIAENHNVIISKRHSYTREEDYYANICTHCNTFIGQHFLFTGYFSLAVHQEDDYKYKKIHLT